MNLLITRIPQVKIVKLINKDVAVLNNALHSGQLILSTSDAVTDLLTSANPIQPLSFKSVSLGS